MTPKHRVTRPHRVEVARRRIVNAGGLTLGGVPFFLTLLNYQWAPARTAYRQGYFSNFFDLQARAFLAGRLDVPAGSLGIEGFVIDGKTYAYYAPFPAILRMPIQMLTTSYDGRLTLASMALAWLLLAWMTIRLLWLARDTLQPKAPLSGWEAVASAVVLGAALGGTTLTFNAGTPWVYHEVYAWSVAFAVSAAYWMVRVVLAPSVRSTVLLAVCILCGGMTRTPTMWALGATTVALGIWLMRRPRDRQTTAGRLVIAAGLFPIGVSVAYNMVKFGHPYLFPLQNQAWTQVNPHRREALAANGGTITGLRYLPTDFWAYLRPDGIRFTTLFPFITLPANPPSPRSGVIFDQTYRTASIPAAMTALTALAVVAVVYLLMRRTQATVPFRWAICAVSLIPVGVLGYGYIANRYTSDFVPALIVGAIVGWWALAGRLARLRIHWQSVVVLGLVLLTLANIWTQMATGAQAAAQTARGPALTSFVSLQHRLSPAALVARTHASPDLPQGGQADDLWVVGDCTSVWLNTGDRYEPWIPVEGRSMTITVRPVPHYMSGILRLIEQHGAVDRFVTVEVDATKQQGRMVVEDPRGNFYSPWFGLAEQTPFVVTATPQPDISQIRISVGDTAYYDLRIPLSEWDSEWHSVPTQPTLVTPTPLYGLIAKVDGVWGASDSLCQRLTVNAPGSAS